MFQILLYLMPVISGDNLNNAVASVANVYAWSASGNVSGLEMANMATCQVTPSSSTSAVTSNQGQGFLIRYGEYHISLKCPPIWQLNFLFPKLRMTLHCDCIHPKYNSILS